MKKNAFRDTVLVVVFNYSNCLNNKEAIRALYAPWFRKIIFYSDLPVVDGHDDVHFVDIKRGFNTHAVFPDLWSRYRDDLEASAGLMYTMDDCILNVHRLASMSADRVVCNYGTVVRREETKTLEGWHWDQPHGLAALNALFAQEALPEIELISGSFSDFFYLPRRFLVPRLFELFDIFARAGVFLEISIPTIIHHIAKGRSNTGHWEQIILWHEDRNKVQDRAYLEGALDRCDFFHPVKFNQSPKLLPWVQEYFANREHRSRNDKCIIITTINAPNDFVLGYARKAGWDLIVVGDSKTRDDDYANVGCIYLGLQEQKALYPSLFDKIPLKSYTRKMFGYLYAIQHGYQVIYETDDDNWYRGDLDHFDCGLVLSKFVDYPGDDRANMVIGEFNAGRVLELMSEHGAPAFTYEPNSNRVWLKNGLPKAQSAHPTTLSGQRVVSSFSAGTGFVNLYRNFTDERIWPRGIPPTHASIDVVPPLEVGHTGKLPVAVIQGLVDNDPDVDAHYRIHVSDQPFFFGKNVNLEVALGPGSVCPFNTQNTFWTDPSVFHALYLPTTVTFRYTDILRGFVALYQLWRAGKTLKFTGPTAFQTRNPHDLQKDYESEVPMYETAEKVIALLESNRDATLTDVYRLLAREGVVETAEIAVVEEWMRLVEQFQASAPRPRKIRGPLPEAIRAHRNLVLDAQGQIAVARIHAQEMAVFSSGEGFAISDEDIADLIAVREGVAAVWSDVVDKLLDAAQARRRNLPRFDALNMLSVGADCFSRVVLSRWGFKRTSALGESSAPFDLAVSHPVAVSALIGNDFEGFMDPAELRFSVETQTCSHTRYPVHFNHERGVKFAENDFAKLRAMYAGRIENFRQMLADPTPLFLLLTLPIFITPGQKHLEEAREIRRLIMDKRTGPTSMLVVNTMAPGEISAVAAFNEPGFQWVNVDAPDAKYVWHDAAWFMSDAGVRYEKLVASEIEGHLKQSGLAPIPELAAPAPAPTSHPEVLVVGHSHVACMLPAAAGEQAERPLIRLPHHSGKAYAIAAGLPRDLHYWDTVVAQARDRVVAILWQGDRPVAQGFFKPGLDVALSEYPELPLDPSAQLVPEAALKVTLAAGLDRLGRLIDAIKAAGGLPVVCGTPPPKEDDDTIRRALLPEFKSLLDEMEATPDSVPLASANLRFKLWALSQSMLRDLAQRHGAGFFAVPAQLQNVRGFLRPEHSTHDVVHANSTYGAAYLAALMDALTPAAQGYGVAA